MAHHTTQRRNLANPEPPKPSMDPTLKKHPKPTTTHHQIRAKPDTPIPSKPSSMSHHISRLNPYHQVRTPQKPILVDTRLQAKAMTVSMVDSSKFSLARPKLERESKATKDVSKGKLERSSKELDKKLNVVKVNDKRKELDDGFDFEGLSEKLKDIELEDLQDGHDGKRPSVSLAMRGGRRRSFCGSRVELADVFASTGVKVVSVDMPPFMQIHAADCARKACDSLEKLSSKTLALTIKKEFDGVYGPAWHCIVGTSFGSFVTHSVGGFMYFSVDQKLYILMFKTTVQRAE
ncbi:uncharacterized protein LOC132175585 [Corylus avellana]|uniref:uncharacterized protein LOC132175585 n=1 Tax=Corylus avellana TaxID=13451 RepID=UPI001E20D359|nr:uncharacterized protein LOC132175585 [Corylus avellana]